jgi:hypothetical protein
MDIVEYVSIYNFSILRPCIIWLCRTKGVLLSRSTHVFVFTDTLIYRMFEWNLSGSVGCAELAVSLTITFQWSLSQNKIMRPHFQLIWQINRAWVAVIAGVNHNVYWWCGWHGEFLKYLTNLSLIIKFTYTDTNIHINIYIHMHSYMYTHIYKNLYIHVYTYLHTWYAHIVSLFTLDMAT